MGKRILVADDSQTIQQAFVFSFGLEDAVLVPARSYEQALSAARQQRPDIVIADAVFGDRSGYDLCSAFKADARLSDVPVFILASKQNPFDEGKAAQVGADGHFIKPFESQKIIDGIYAAISAGSTSKATPVGAMGVVGSVIPEAQDTTSKISVVEAAPLEDDDNYGEFSIESSASASAPPAPTPAPVPVPAPVRAPAPPAMRSPVAAAVPLPPPVRPAPPAPTAPPRPSLIPGIRPGTMRPPAPPPQALGQRTPPPVTMRAPTGQRPTVPSTPTAPDDAMARPAMNRTMMGMPSAFAAGAPPVAPVIDARAPVATPTPPEPMRVNVIPISESVRQPIVTPMVPAPLPALVDRVRSVVDDKVAELAGKGPEYAAIAKLSREVIEQIVWEVVPELAEAIIRENLDRLTKK